MSKKDIGALSDLYESVGLGPAGENMQGILGAPTVHTQLRADTDTPATKHNLSRRDLKKMIMQAETLLKKIKL